MSRPAAGVGCYECNAKGHFCPATIFQSEDDGGQTPLCLDCADGEPCSVERVAAAKVLEPEDDLQAAGDRGKEARQEPAKRGKRRPQKPNQTEKILAFAPGVSASVIAAQLGIKVSAVYNARLMARKKVAPFSSSATVAAPKAVKAPKVPKQLRQVPIAAPSEKATASICLSLTRSQLDRVWEGFSIHQCAAAVTSVLTEFLIG